MDRGTWLAFFLLFLIPLPFISTNCLVSFSANFMKTSDEKVIKDFKKSLSTFRWRQIESLVLITILFIISLAIANWIGIKSFPHYTIFSTIFLTHAAIQPIRMGSSNLGWRFSN